MRHTQRTQMDGKGKAKQLLKTILPSPLIKGCRDFLSTTSSTALIPSATVSLVGQSQNLRKKYPAIKSAEHLANNYLQKPERETKTLDLGCGANIRNPFSASRTFGVDIRSDLSQKIKQADLSEEPIPFGNDYFDYCTAFDVIEHIPRNSWAGGAQKLAFLELMNEIYRVLKPGGLFLHSTPAFPSKEAFQDPTHVNIITEDTFPLYFCEPENWARELGYGFNGRFELVAQGWVKNIWLTGLLKAIK